MSAALPAARDVIPHTGDCVLLESLLAADAGGLRARAHIVPTPYSLPDGSLPGWAGVEIMAQAVCAYAGVKSLAAGGGPKPGLLLGTRHYRSTRAVLAAGARFEVRVAPSTLGEDGLGVFDCELSDGDETIARAALTVFEPDDAFEFLTSRRP